jgi:hypothetical protein
MVLIPDGAPSLLGLPMPIQGGRNSSFLVMVWQEHLRVSSRRGIALMQMEGDQTTAQTWGLVT